METCEIMSLVSSGDVVKTASRARKSAAGLQCTISLQLRMQLMFLLTLCCLVYSKCNSFFWGLQNQQEHPKAKKESWRVESLGLVVFLLFPILFIRKEALWVCLAMKPNKRQMISFPFGTAAASEK
ncbi:PREDICTED: uncharacterized protein LOC105141570 [Populus euphratica]|uniref:Uncharacterized protein LOC105141570 n=1 Tax=Populus euphratica TaxID=75702 RepID=A0AAJ6VEU9_POPEU|nr:PREDICTED: uncharacterized protein LOC105141570 [Populus euphratica]